MLFLGINYIHKNTISLLPSTDMVTKFIRALPLVRNNIFNFIHLSPQVHRMPDVHAQEVACLLRHAILSDGSYV